MSEQEQEIVIVNKGNEKKDEPSVGIEGAKLEKKDGKSKEDERRGLTNQEADELVQKWGYNELPSIEIPLWWVFLQQFMGTMPYMLELCILLAAIAQDWVDIIILLALLITNGMVGFTEELKSAAALAELTNKMEKKIATVRSGTAVQLLTRLLVPGDVCLLVGGCEVPADIEWLEGDTLEVDTAALTGESLPRKYPSDRYGTLILCGATIKAGEAYGIVRKTGLNTEIGGAQAEIMKDKAHVKKSVFEDRVLQTVKIIIVITVVDVIIIFLIQGIAGKQFTKDAYQDLLLACVSVLIASIPVALPLVLQVTMVLGAAKMATKYHSVVTSLPALQDIASMTVLCSDKTGTLTTARISINADHVWTPPGSTFTKADMALYAGLASNRDKKEDAIDRSVIGYVDRVYGGEALAKAAVAEYTKTRSVGFNPIYKRVLWEYTHPVHGKITVAKGLPTKVLNTADHGEDDAVDQWKCEGFAELEELVKDKDYNFSKSGYKTLGVSLRKGDGPWQFVGILPMLDPPRHDSKKTIQNLNNAGVEVKMITGDHLNIAIETARLIGLGQNIHGGSEIRDGSRSTDELIHESNGFAQVLPRDKREVVLVLRDKYNYVVGMTGDGVNDAPALSAAQCGIAVDDATDAAKNAAAIILTSPGLSAIYSAVVESRRIFRKLKSYATYRFAATIQLVIVLTLLIYISNCYIDSLFIVLMALFNDITMLPIAYDIQVASKNPEHAEVTKMLVMSLVLGLLEAGFSLIFAYSIQYLNFFSQPYTLDVRGPGYTLCEKNTQAMIWLQMFIATELLIFSTRAQSYMVLSVRPSASLATAVIAGCFLFCIIAGQTDTFGNLSATDILCIWFWNLGALLVIDVLKVQLTQYFGESLETLPDEETFEAGHEQVGEGKSAKDVEATGGAAPPPVQYHVKVDGEGKLVQVAVSEEQSTRRENAELARVNNAIVMERRLTEKNLEGVDAIDVSRRMSENVVSAARTASSVELAKRLGSVINTGSGVGAGSSTNLRPGTSAVLSQIAPGPGGSSAGGLVTSGSLAPNTPGSLAMLKKSRVRKA